MCRTRDVMYHGTGRTSETGSGKNSGPVNETEPGPNIKLKMGPVNEMEPEPNTNNAVPVDEMEPEPNTNNAVPVN